MALKHIGGQTDGAHHGAQTTFPKEIWIRINNGNINKDRTLNLLRESGGQHPFRVIKVILGSFFLLEIRQGNFTDI